MVKINCAALPATLIESELLGHEKGAFTGAQVRKKGLFRSDLWYRLNVYPITVPPLRERRSDIPLLANTFIKRFSKKLGRLIKSIDPDTMTQLQQYRWPGNIRELQNTIERALINTQGPMLKLVDKLNALTENGSAAPVNGKSLEQLEREIIIARLEETNWRISGPKGAAESLGLHPNTLRARMTKLDIRKLPSSPSRVH